QRPSLAQNEQYRRYDLFAQRCPTCTLLGEAQHTRYKCLLVIDPIKPSFSEWQPYMCLNSKTPRKNRSVSFKKNAAYFFSPVAAAFNFEPAESLTPRP